jgi:hypothetical protein
MRRVRSRPWRPAAVAGFAAVAIIGLAGCGSASSPAPNTKLLGTTQQQECTSVADVLSDGPDPGADPVGYAQAQVLPLRQLRLTDASLSRSVKALAGAYQAYATSAGSARKSAAGQVTKAAAAVNAICPGAAN